MERIVALVDMDCFYVQVEQRAKPELKGRPCAVVQYNQWKGGGIIAVGYEARAFGVSRQMRGDEAKRRCSDIVLVTVPNVRGKADLQKYREAGAEVIEVLSQFSQFVERASIDEAYIDLTEEVDKRLEKGERIVVDDLSNTFVCGYDVQEDAENKDEARKASVTAWLDDIYEGVDVDSKQAMRLAVGSAIAEEMRAAVYEQTQFRCSAGIAHNKVLAKLVCGLHKPNKQTVLPHSSVPHLFKDLPLRKVRNLGGKFGQQLMEEFKVENMLELTQFPLATLQEKCGDKNGLWVYEMCRGIDHEPVSARQLPKSIGCSKNFHGKLSLDTKQKVVYWVGQLCDEVVERLHKDKEANGRVAKLLNVSLGYRTGHKSSQHASRSCALVKYDAKKVAQDSVTLLSQFNAAPGELWSPAITNIGISATKFMDNENNSSVAKFLTQQSPSTSSTQTVAKKQKRKRKSAIEGMFSAMMDKKDTEISAILSSSVTKESTPSLKVTSNKKSFFQAYKEKKDTEKEEYVQIPEEKRQKANTFGGFFAAQVLPRSKIQTDEKVEESSISDLESNVVCNQYESCYSDDDDFDIPKRKCVKDVNRARDFEVASTSRMHTTSLSKSKHNTIQADELPDAHDPVSYDSIQPAEEPCTFEVKDNSNSMHVHQNFGINDYDPNEVDTSRVENTERKDSLDQEKSLQISNNSEEQSSNFSANDYIQCEECGKRILVWEMPEHSDFHFAQNLMKEENAVLRAQTAVRIDSENKKKRTSLGNENRKKGRSSGGPSQKLTCFFNRK